MILSPLMSTQIRTQTESQSMPHHLHLGLQRLRLCSGSSLSYTNELDANSALGGGRHGICG